MRKEKIIIIGGGVGPRAGILLHNHILENTLTDGTDQDHLEVYHFSRSSDIPDRSIAIELGREEEPALGMYRTFKVAASAISGVQAESLGGIPCNTFHAPAIFGRFTQYMQDLKPKIRILNMIDETIEGIMKSNPGVGTIGIMSTTGTRRTGIYSEPLQSRGIKTIQVPEEAQSKLHDSIYNREWGIKAATPIILKTKSILEKFSDYLIDMGAEMIILGCTEIPLVMSGRSYRGIPLIDPMRSLARALIREANPDKLR